jgi:TRAP-type mannitol/chloroaromatic compound transport system substrate-binding protein
MTLKSQQPAARRRFLQNASAGAVGAVAAAAPMVSRAQTVSFRFQSTWPARDIFHEYANDFYRDFPASQAGAGMSFCS